MKEEKLRLPHSYNPLKGEILECRDIPRGALVLTQKELNVFTALFF